MSRPSFNSYRLFFFSYFIYFYRYLFGFFSYANYGDRRLRSNAYIRKIYDLV